MAHWPRILLGDRGELLVEYGSGLVMAVNLDIENRGDAKGVAERSFRTLQAIFEPYAPGFVGSDFRSRGGRDYRLDAKLTIDDFTKFVIFSILKSNNGTHRSYVGSPVCVVG